MVKYLIRWLKAVDKGYNVTYCGLKLVSERCADDVTLFINSVEDMMSLFDTFQ